MIVRRAMEYLSDLLQETFSVQLCSRDKSIFSQQNVFSFQSGVETIRNVSVKKLIYQMLKLNLGCSD